MTRSTTIKRVGWLAAVLAVSVLTVHAQAGQRQRNPNRSRQDSRQVERQRGQTERQRQADRQKQAERRKQADRPRQAQRGEKAKQRERQAQAERQRQVKADRRRAERERQAKAERQRAAERERQAKANRQRAVERQRAEHQRAARQKAERERATAQARAERQRALARQRKAADQVEVRGVNWGVNAQRNKLAERQAKVRRQEQRIDQVRIENRQVLRQAKQRFDNKVDRTLGQLDRREDRLDARARAIRSPIVRYRPVAPIVRYRKPAVFYRPSHYDDRRWDDDCDFFGFNLIFGDSGLFHYEHGYRRHNCCTGGYYIWKWVPAYKVTRYDRYGCPYTVVIRAGYYKRVWIPHYCRRGVHVYYRD